MWLLVAIVFAIVFGILIWNWFEVYEEVAMLGVDVEVGVYGFLSPATLRALHYYKGIRGTERWLENIPPVRWDEAEKLAVAHVRTFCKCGEGSVCMACSVGKVLEVL